MAVVDELRRARRDPSLAVVEGFHALKHALRFGARVERVLAAAPDELERLAADLAPDLAGRFAALAEPVGEAVLAAVAPHAPPTGVVAIARRPRASVEDALARAGPVVLLEEPRRLGNLGAVVRVAAAADAAGVIATGASDPWHPDAIRGSAGLHFALPVVRASGLPPGDRPLVAVDPAGEPLGAGALPPRAVLAFGTERHGLSGELLARATARVAIPMREGVSSLNLATAVAAVLFAQRLR